jgi:hypothetical protein
VIKPGVNNKMPDINIRKPLPIRWIGFVFSYFKLKMIFLPWFCTKSVPITAVEIIIKIVFRVPTNSFTLKNTIISIIGTAKSKKNHFIILNHFD